MKQKRKNIWFRSGLPPAGNRGPVPITWQGWLIWLLFVLAILGAIYLSSAIHNLLFMIVSLVIVAFVFMKIMSATIK